MGKFIETLGTQAGGAVAGAILGMATAGWNDNRQVRQQKRLNDVEKDMINYQMQKQYEMWEKTNYAAQKEQLKKAGLNPGLLYGMGGAGGTTTGNASAGGANAPGGGGEVMAGIGMGLERQMMAAQIELAKSQAEKNRVEANKTAGVDTELGQTQIKSLTQGIENQKAVEVLTKAQSRISELEGIIKDRTMEEQIDEIVWSSRKTLEELDALARENIVDKATMYTRIKMVKAEYIGQLLENGLRKAQTTNVNQQTEESKARVIQIANDIQMKIEQNMREWDELPWEHKKVMIADELKNHYTEIPESVKAILGPIANIIGKGAGATTAPKPIGGFHNR